MSRRPVGVMDSSLSRARCRRGPRIRSDSRVDEAAVAQGDAHASVELMCFERPLAGRLGIDGKQSCRPCAP